MRVDIRFYNIISIKSTLLSTCNTQVEYAMFECLFGYSHLSLNGSIHKLLDLMKNYHEKINDITLA